MNFAGNAVFQLAKNGRMLRAEQVAVYMNANGNPGAFRSAETRHRFFTLSFGPAYLLQEFRFVLDGLRPEVRAFCHGEPQSSPAVWIESMPGQLLGLRSQLLEPPVSSSAHRIWYHSKITEILSHFLFQPEAPAELFCERHHRVNRERCERVLFLLHRDMENPPSLQMLADEVGCSPFYLSRLFAQEIGISIPKALRKLRIEKSAELLREGGISVTDAAMQVGYSSLGAFNKAFVELIGCTPTQFSKRSSRD